MFDDSQLNSLYRYAASLTGDSDTAYDLLHDALEKYCSRRSAEPDKPMAFIRTIIRNRYFDGYRHRQRFPEQVYDDTTVFDLGQSSLEDLAIQRDMLGKIMHSINSDERELLFLWAVEGMTIDEIATFLDTARGTLLSRLHRLRAKLVKRGFCYVGVTAS